MTPETNEVFVENPVKKRIPLTHRTFAKFIAFVLTVITMLLTVASIISAIFIADQELYLIPEESYRQRVFEGQAYSDCYNLLLHTVNYSEELTYQYNQRNYSYCSIVDTTADKILWTTGNPDAAESKYTYSYSWLIDNTSSYPDLYPEYFTGLNNAHKITVTISLTDPLTKYDEYFWADTLISAAYAIRYYIYLVILSSLLIMCACFVFLICASGRRSGLPTAQPGWGTKIPFDLLSAAAAFAVALISTIFFEAGNNTSEWVMVAIAILFCIPLSIIIIGWTMSFALRIKLGYWWKNTIIFYVLNFLWRILMILCKGICAVLRAIPILWKTSLVFLLIAALEFLGLMFAFYDPEALLLLWFLEKLILFPVIIFGVLMLKKLQSGGEALSSGNLDYQVDTKKMFWDFKRHGENLNRIGEGMTRAVDERVKSERMKTELITNVSHDIKTPLTSIINYADLIAKEPCDNAAITEYSEVLLRQSERLKRLIDDLVEVSKATTGNLEVVLAPCEAGVLLTQIAGEYEQKLADCRLELITSQPKTTVEIMADGRRLWRVFDNLMNNICKYAQSGTRVYLTLEKQNNNAVIIFRNTSREALNMPADELLERFSRGDSSRNTEGNGLGLSIAKSLTELQKGTMELVTDGDLFKVILFFPIIA